MWNDFNRDVAFCKFAASFVEQYAGPREQLTLWAPYAEDGTIWAFCPWGSDAYKAIPGNLLAYASKGDRVHFFEYNYSVVFSRSKQDLLDLASIMGPILYQDLQWPNVPPNPKALDLSQQQELEQRLADLNAD